MITDLKWGICLQFSNPPVSWGWKCWGRWWQHCNHTPSCQTWLKCRRSWTNISWEISCGLFVITWREIQYLWSGHHHSFHRVQWRWWKVRSVLFNQENSSKSLSFLEINDDQKHLVSISSLGVNVAFVMSTLKGRSPPDKVSFQPNLNWR